MQTAEIKPSKKPATKSSTKPVATAKPKKAASSTAGKSTTKAATSKPVKIKALDAGLRHKLITETAHYLSEKRCCGGSEMDDWLFAEKLVDGMSKALQ